MFDGATACNDGGGAAAVRTSRRRWGGGLVERYEIETFLALAEELHFARTAERLRVSPGRVSQTVKALERRIGGALFERNSRRVALTPVGRQLRDELLPAYRQIQRAIGRASAACADISGVLRVGFTAPWSGDLIVRAAERFQSRHPRCAVELLEVTFNAAIEALRDEEVDLVIAEPPVVEPGIIVGPVLISERRALVVPATHFLAAQETVSREDLALLPLVTAAGVSEAWRDAFYPRRTPRATPSRTARPPRGGRRCFRWSGRARAPRWPPSERGLPRPPRRHLCPVRRQVGGRLRADVAGRGSVRRNPGLHRHRPRTHPASGRPGLNQRARPARPEPAVTPPRPAARRRAAASASRPSSVRARPPRAACSTACRPGTCPPPRAAPRRPPPRSPRPPDGRC